jgi:tryptophanyl-tRNA synthetase
VGVFIKVDEDVQKLLDNAEKLLKNHGFTHFQRITKYKALYINDAKEHDIPSINDALARSEPRFSGYGFLQPSATFHRFMTGLTGEKMSSSNPESAIFLTDTPDEAQNKIMHAKTGGAVSLAVQKKEGGRPEECVVYELFLYHLIEDDTQLEQIHCSCKNGERMCGECKKQAAALTKKLLQELKERRPKGAKTMDQYLS